MFLSLRPALSHYRFVVELETVNHTFGINSLSMDLWIERV